MTRLGSRFLVVALALVLAGARSARAETLDQAFTAETRASDRPDVTRFLPTTSSATVGNAADVTNAWGGYDGAARTPVFSVTTELRLVRRVSLVAGIAYTSASMAEAGVRPQIGARVQVFQQPASGIDASAAFSFRQDRFTSEDGLFQGVVALGRSFGRTSAVLNLAYGQDGEGDDHEGEVRLAGVHRIHGGLHLGVEGRYMHSLASTDPHRAANDTPSMETMAGPLVAFMAGSWAFVAEAGVSSRRTARLETGLATLAGVSTSF